MRLHCGTRFSPDGTVAVLSAEGEVDVATAPILRKQLDGLEAQAKTIVIDLAGVSFLDSTGLGVLIGARRRLVADGVRMLVINAVPTVWRVFKITGLVEPLRVHPMPDPPEVLDPFAMAAAS
jgi:anti-sigma B factor antagonist